MTRTATKTPEEPVLDRAIGDILGEREPLTLSGGTMVSEAAREMAERHMGAVLVMDGGELEGIFTERDLLERVVAGGLDADETALMHVMTPDPVALPPEADIMNAIFLMRDHGTRHILVKAGSGVLGVLSVRDLLRAVVQDAMAGRLERDDLWSGFPV